MPEQIDTFLDLPRPEKGNAAFFVRALQEIERTARGIPAMIRQAPAVEQQNRLGTLQDRLWAWLRTVQGKRLRSDHQTLRIWATEISARDPILAAHLRWTVGVSEAEEAAGLGLAIALLLGVTIYTVGKIVVAYWDRGTKKEELKLQAANEQVRHEAVRVLNEAAAWNVQFYRERGEAVPPAVTAPMKATIAALAKEKQPPGLFEIVVAVGLTAGAVVLLGHLFKRRKGRK